MKHAAALALAVAMLLAPFGAFRSVAAQIVPAPLQVSVEPIALYLNRPQDRRVGELSYRGGLVLSSPDRRFGGWSDLTVSDDGTQLLAISDEAHWLLARLNYDQDGDLFGLTAPQIEPMLNIDGEPLRGKEGDAEGLAPLTERGPNGPVLVSFERDHRVWRYDLTSGIAGARPLPISVGPWINGLDDNAGLEAIAMVSPDSLLALAENASDANGDLTGAFGRYDDGSDPHMFGIVRRPPFLITGVTRIPGGDLLLLERRFSFARGVGMEIRRIDADEILEGARIDGRLIVELGAQGTNIDNMEGISARLGPNGETLLYLISDNNFQPLLQRTLLLMFELEAN